MPESKFKTDLRDMMEKYGTVNVVLQMSELCYEQALLMEDKSKTELWYKNGKALYNVAPKIKIN